ncbi:hypothetical protein [Nesterenkonia suensis]
MSADDMDPDGSLDGTDDRILSDLAELWSAADPVPEDLALEIRFQLSVQALRAEVAELQYGESQADPTADGPVLVGVDAFRDGAPIRTDTLTFSCDRLSTMITVTPVSPEGEPHGAGAARGADRTGAAVRIDGWVTVPECRIELRVLTTDRSGASAVRHLRADDDGRFTVDAVPVGPAQLILRHRDDTVITPYFDL